MIIYRSIHVAANGIISFFGLTLFHNYYWTLYLRTLKPNPLFLRKEENTDVRQEKIGLQFQTDSLKTYT